MQKLDRVLLIDDSDADNFIHTRAIKKAGVVEEIVVQKNGLQALNYLTTKIDGHYPRPRIIFLDINMPGMNGWEFLDEYAKLDEDIKGGVMVCMVTSSLSQVDEKRAAAHVEVDRFINKPLTKELMLEIYSSLSR